MIFLYFYNKYYFCKKKEMEKCYLPQIQVGEIVAGDVRTAGVFTKAGIDFCCGGKKSLSESCAEAGISMEKMIEDLEAVTSEPVKPGQNYREWELGFLADYIVNTHHRFVVKNLPELIFYTRKIAGVHGDRHPELLEVADLFGKIDAELQPHLVNEENILFPAIRKMEKKTSEEQRTIIRSEISRMQGEHDFAGGTMDKINRITDGYRIPEDACNTYKAALNGLKAFEEDLHLHVHLENNILFLKAMQL
jgi:regulator of cell morphogenesis and NO signaling